MEIKTEHSFLLVQVSQFPYVLISFSSMRRSLRKKDRDTDSYTAALEQQKYYDHDRFEDNSRFRPSSRQFDDNSSRFRLSDRQSYDDSPHPLEEDYIPRGSLRQNGKVYRNRIVEEEDEDVMTATYMPQGQRQMPSKLPPLEAAHGGKKKKKKKFLKKMAEHSPRAYDDD